MSTRATVWIKNETSGEERFLYHHCDGYGLDEGINPILRELPDDKWNVNDVAQAIIDYDDAYGRHRVDGVGWDSEYVYKILVGDKTLEKFDCGIGDDFHGDCREEKTREKYSVKKYKYSRIKIEDPATKAQVLKIQLLDMIKFACRCIESDVVTDNDVDKIQEIFKIIHRGE